MKRWTCSCVGVLGMKVFFSVCRSEKITVKGGSNRIYQITDSINLQSKREEKIKREKLN